MYKQTTNENLYALEAANSSASRLELQQMNTNNSRMPCIPKDALHLFTGYTLNFSYTTDCSGSDTPGGGEHGLGTSIGELERKILVTLYTPLAVIALIMNIFIIVVIIKNRLYTKPMFVFIFTLAFCDIIMLTCNTPIALYYSLVKDWIFGRTLCRVLYPTFAFPVYVSSWTIAFISVERYRATHPNRGISINRTRAGLMLLGASFISLLSAIPLFIYTKAESTRDRYPDAKDNSTRCMEDWPEGNAKAIYGTVVLSTLFVLPATITIVLHILIYRVLNQRLRVTQRSAKQAMKYTQGKSAAELRAKKTHCQNRAAGKILLSIVVVYIVCWSPAIIFMIILDIAPETVPKKKVDLVRCSLNLLATCSSCINPIFYGWLNRAFRKEAHQLMATCGWPKCIQTRLKKGLSSQKSTGLDLETGPKESTEHASDTNGSTGDNRIATNYQFSSPYNIASKSDRPTVTNCVVSEHSKSLRECEAPLDEVRLSMLPKDNKDDTKET